MHILYATATAANLHEYIRWELENTYVFAIYHQKKIIIIKCNEKKKKETEPNVFRICMLVVGVLANSREQQTDEVNKFLCAGNCNFFGSRFVEFHFLANIVYYISVQHAARHLPHRWRRLNDKYIYKWSEKLILKFFLLLSEFDLFAADSCVSCNNLENDRIKEKVLRKRDDPERDRERERLRQRLSPAFRLQSAFNLQNWFVFETFSIKRCNRQVC